MTLVRLSIVVWITMLLIMANVCPAAAQLIAGRQGQMGGVFGGRRPIDPNRSSQSFDLTFDLGGGYDRDPVRFTLAPGDSGLSSWYASTASLAGRYRGGHTRRSFEARGRSYFNTQSNAANSLIGGEATVNTVLRFGQRGLNQVSMSARSSYEPAWVFGAFGPSAGISTEDPTLGIAPPQGILEQRWLVLSGSVGFQKQWRRRHTTRLGYDNRRLRPITGAGVESRSQLVTVEHNWMANRNLSVLMSYRADENVQPDGNEGLRERRFQTAESGLRYERRLSPIRRYSITLRGGAAHVIGSTTMRPSANASFEVVPSRFWSMSAEYTRSVMVLTGVSSIPVLNNTVELSLNGTPVSRLRYSVFGSFTRAEFVSDDPNRIGSNDVAGVTAEMRVALSSWSATFVSYGFYHHRVEDPRLVASGFPPRYDRHSIRVGMTLWLPLYGTF